MKAIVSGDGALVHLDFVSDAQADTDWQPPDGLTREDDAVPHVAAQIAAYFRRELQVYYAFSCPRSPSACGRNITDIRVSSRPCLHLLANECCTVIMRDEVCPRHSVNRYLPQNTKSLIAPLHASPRNKRRF